MTDNNYIIYLLQHDKTYTSQTLNYTSEFMSPLYSVSIAGISISDLWSASIIPRLLASDYDIFDVTFPRGLKHQ